MFFFVAKAVCVIVMRAQCKTSPNTSSAGFPTDQRNGDKEFVIRRAATNRVLNVLRHWVSKHSPVTTSQHTDIFIGAVHNTVILILVVYIYIYIF